MTLVGTSVRSIRIVDKLGEGGMGEVYLGFDEVLGRQVAIKAIRASMRQGGKAKARFFREARLLSQLEHPNICRIYEFIEGDDSDFIVLELVHGETLSAALERGLSPAEKMSVALQVAEALRAAHSMSVVHRDLKPENIMVGSDNVVKVLDFGLARSLPREDAEIEAGGSHTFDAADLGDAVDENSVTELGHAVGTPRYMSPEQARGRVLTAASDVYSFGLVLQEIFSTRPPYDSNIGRERLQAKVLWGDTNPVEGLDSEFKALIESMKSLGPGRRPTVEAVAEKLRWIDDRPRRRRRGWVAATIAAVLVAAAVSSTIGFIQARRSQRSAENARTQAEAVNAFLTNMLSSAAPNARGAEVQVVDVLDQAAWSLDLEFADRPLDRAAVLHTLGSTYLALGKYDQAHDHLSTALQLRRDGLGNEHPETLASEIEDGRALFLRGDIEEGETALRRVLERCEVILGADQPLTLAAALEVGLVLRERGSYDEAEAVFRRVVDGRRALFGDDHLLTLAARGELAVLFRLQGRYAEAETLHREIVAVKERVFGEDHPLTANSISDLAAALLMQGKEASAEPLYRRTLAIRRDRYGVDHPVYLKALGNVATVVSRQGRFEEAVAIGSEQVEAMRRVLGEDHPDTLAGENNLATAYRRWGRLEKAEAIYRSILQRQRSLFGNDHPQTVRTLSNLAKNAHDMGRLEDAESFSRQVVEIRRRTLGDEHPDTLLGIYNHGYFLTALGRWEEAEVALREAFETNLRVRGDADFLTPLSADLLATAIVELGRIEEAESFVRERVDVRRRVFGDDHEVTRKGVAKLAAVLRVAGRNGEAQALEDQLEILK